MQYFTEKPLDSEKSKKPPWLKKAWAITHPIRANRSNAVKTRFQFVLRIGSRESRCESQGHPSTQFQSGAPKRGPQKFWSTKFIFGRFFL